MEGFASNLNLSKQFDVLQQLLTYVAANRSTNTPSSLNMAKQTLAYPNKEGTGDQRKIKDGESSI